MNVNHLHYYYISDFRKYCTVLLISLCSIFSNYNSYSQQDSSKYLFSKAIYLSNKGNYDGALQILDSLIITSSIKANDSLLLSYILMKAEVYTQKRAFQYSLESFNKALEIIIEKNLISSIIYADYYQLKGNYYFTIGQIDSSFYYLNTSLKLRHKILVKTDSTFSYSLNKLGNIYLTYGNYDSAQYFYDQAINLSLTKKNSENYEISSYYQNLAIILSLKGDFINAESNFIKSLKIKKKFFESNDLALARIYNNLGRFYSSISKFDSSFKYYSKAEEIYLKNYDINNFNLAPIYWNKGTDLIHKGDYEKAINYLKKAYHIYTDNLEANNPTILLIINDLGLAFERLGNYKEAISYFKLGLNYTSNPAYVKILRNLANTYSLIGENAFADKYFNISIAQAKYFFGENSYDLALCYSNYGDFLLNTYKNEKGLDYYYDGIKILEKIFTNKHRDVAQIYTNISLYYSSTNHYLEALQSVQNALNSLFSDFTPTDNYQNPDITEQLPDLFTLSAFYQKSLTLFNLYKIDQSNKKYITTAFSTIQLCFNIISKLRNSYSDEESKLIFINAASSAFELGVEISYYLSLLENDKYYLHKAFEINEKNKSVLLLSSLRDLEALQSSGIPREYQIEERLLKDKIFTLNSLIYNEKLNVNPNKEKIIFWENEIFTSKYKYDSLLSTFENNYPSFYKLKYDDSVVTISHLQSALDLDQVVLEYLTTDSLYFLFIISKSGLNIIKIIKTPELSNSLVEVLKIFKGNTLLNISKSDYQSYINSSYLLFQNLIYPASRFIENKRIILIPDDQLGYLSFDLLLTSQIFNNDINFRSLPYLIKKYSITYSSSATLFIDANNKSSIKANKSLIAFAPKYDDQTKTRSAPNDSLQKTLRQLLPIPGVMEEVRNITRIFKGDEYIEQDATESTFKNKAPEYNILHLAMHTIIDDQNPMFSKLVFTPGKDQEDGLLNTYELFNLDLKGSLAVLSACNTGTGRLEKGEGIISLARGFIYAGIPSIVMTLWEVEDYSSADLMTSFYGYLKQGLPKDIALQKAKLEYLDHADALKSHPYFWAGFVNIGSPQPLEPPAKRTLYWLFPLISMLFLVIIFINLRVYLRKRRIKK